jgi:hypothetical protein
MEPPGAGGAFWPAWCFLSGNRSGITKVDIGGASLLPDSRAEAKVEQRQGHIEIEAEFRCLSAERCSRYGKRYKRTRRERTGRGEVRVIAPRQLHRECFTVGTETHRRGP